MTLGQIDSFFTNPMVFSVMMTGAALIGRAWHRGGFTKLQTGDGLTVLGFFAFLLVYTTLRHQA